MDIQQVIKDAFAEKAKSIGLSYEAIEIETQGDQLAILTARTLGGVRCRGGMNSGRLPLDTAEDQRTFAYIAVDRSKDWWDRIQKEYDEDVAVLAGGTPTLNPKHRITEPGHYTNYPFASSATA